MSGSRKGSPVRIAMRSHLAVGAEEGGFQQPQALAFAFQNFAQAMRQAMQAGGDDILGDHRFGETLLGHQIGQGRGAA